MASSVIAITVVIDVACVEVNLLSELVLIDGEVQCMLGGWSHIMSTLG